MQSLSDSVDPNSASNMDSASNDFKMTSLGEVQRIIGLSLSKIQLGRNQRGGLPLHKNLLVATVLNKARDLYMQETMYMNYKMMTGQFAAAAASANHQVGVGSQMSSMVGQHHSPYGPPHGYHYHAASNHTNEGACEEDLEPQTEANEADYDEDSESDVEDECDSSNANVVTSSAVTASVTRTSPPVTPYHHSTMMSSPQQHQPLQQPQQVQQPSQPSSNNDEGFIDEPDCDCDARNFSTSESRVPFQYCYHCAPFHPSNGRGPTLVPSPCPSPTSAATSSTASTSSSTVTSSTVTSSSDFNDKSSCISTSGGTSCPTLYDMDSQATEVNNRGTKRGRSHSLEATEEEVEERAKKKRRESTEESSSSPDTSQDESGYQSDSSQHEMFHPAFRGVASTPTSQNDGSTVVGSGQTMEIDQITSLVSIFSFGQHIMAAAAAANNTRTTSNCASSTTTKSSTTTSTSSDSRKQQEDEDDKKGEGHHAPSSEDSDSESDTSSDSGHSSDDHEAAKEEELSSVSTTQPPDLCATSVASVVQAKETPPCVEVASL